MVTLDRVPGPDNLYIGGIFSLRRKEALEQANITHVLSVLRLPLDDALFAKYKHLVVEVDDVDDENLLEHFAATNAFIQEGLDGGGGVLVHCAMGKSRSTTTILAYQLHQNPTLTPATALARLREVRPISEPNDGFKQQLALYHQLRCPANLDAQPAYQRWLYRREVEASVACGMAPETIRFRDEGDEGRGKGREDGASEGGPEAEGESEVELRCRKCRRRLAASQHLVPHTPKPLSSSSEDADADAFAPISQLAPSPHPLPTRQPLCAHLYIDPLSWMRPELEQGKLDGRLECPKCGTNVGKYAWQGMRCSCGGWVVPAVCLARGRVDEVQLRLRPGLRTTGVGRGGGGNL